MNTTWPVDSQALIRKASSNQPSAFSREMSMGQSVDCKLQISDYGIFSCPLSSDL